MQNNFVPDKFFCKKLHFLHFLLKVWPNLDAKNNVDFSQNHVDSFSTNELEEFYHAIDLAVKTSLREDKTLQQVKERWHELSKEISFLENLHTGGEGSRKLYFQAWKTMINLSPEKLPEVLNDNGFQFTLKDFLQWLMIFYPVANNRKLRILVWTVTPVQSYINVSRKTMDLWGASQVLSTFSMLASLWIAWNYGPEHLIYPSWLENDLLDLLNGNKEFTTSIRVRFANFPNRFVALIPESEENVNLIKEIDHSNFFSLLNLKELIKDKSGYEQILNYFRITLSSEVFDLNGFFSISQEKQYDFHASKSFFSSFYMNALGQAERKLAALKQVYELKNSFAEEGQKCTLCGQYKALSLCSQKEQVPFSVNEKLCAVCYLKRAWNFNYPTILKNFTEKLGFNIFSNVNNKSETSNDNLQNSSRLNISHEMRNEPFPSTSEVGSWKFKKRLSLHATTKDIDLLNAFITRIKEIFGSDANFLISTKPYVAERWSKLSKSNLEDINTILWRYDGQWLYPESWRESYLRNEFGFQVSDKDLDSLKSILAELSPHYPLYFALLMMDGDEIGNWVNGSKLKSVLGEKFNLTPFFHARFSSLLTWFALNVVTREIEKRRLGRLVYAGGDDVLALMSPIDVFWASFKIQKAYKDLTKNIISNDYLNENKVLMTISASIVIAYHKLPLEWLLDEVRWANKRAKDLGRDGLYVKLITSSRSQKEMFLHWDWLYNPVFVNFLKFFTHHKISTRLPHMLEAIYTKMVSGNEKPSFQAIRDALALKLKRLSLHGQEAKRINLPTVLLDLFSFMWHNNKQDEFFKQVDFMTSISEIIH